MHLGIPALLNFYHEHTSDQFLVLVTIIGTEGSTYRKPGAMMLISSDGAFEGMISGGCLEGDLLHHAAEVLANGKVKFVTYDMHAGDDIVWGLGIGCDGIIHLMLQRLDKASDFGFLAALQKSQTKRQNVLLALTTTSGEVPAPGTFAMLNRAGEAVGEPALLGVLDDLVQQEWPGWRSRITRNTQNNSAIEAILINIPPPTSILVCGAGPDAVPVVQALCALDWSVTVVDHRPAFAKKGRFPERCHVIQARPAQLAEKVDLDEIDAAVIMSHHLDNDSIYLRQLAGHKIPYLGCLGPRARRDRLREMAECPDAQIYGPVGLDIGAELPEAIALSLVAEIHAVLNQRSGLPLTTPDKES